MKDLFKDKTVLVTGGAGSIGSALVEKVLQYDPKVIRVLDISETGLFNLEHKFNSRRIRILIGDIRDKERLVRAVEGVDILFHAAALKHVPLCELNPFEAVKANVLGTKNLIEAATTENISKFITISTDKAVKPINILGASKLLAERLTVSANSYKGKRKTVFACVRFGNVLNSQGSVLTVFKEQIRKGGPVTVTDGAMTRFIMSIDKATDLVLEATHLAKGGEIFIFKMPALRIKDLAKAMILELAQKYGFSPKEIKIEYIGKRSGEKMFEELMNEDEAELAREYISMFILSSVKANGKDKGCKYRKIYMSKDCKLMSLGEIRETLRGVYS